MNITRFVIYPSCDRGRVERFAFTQYFVEFLSINARFEDLLIFCYIYNYLNEKSNF